MMLPVVNRIRNELSDDSGVDNLVHGRVRTHEPDAGDLSGSFKAFIVLSQLGAPPIQGARLAGVQVARISARCYGTTAANAGDVWAAVKTALDGTGPRIHPNGLGIFQTLDDTGGADGSDPDTKQPVMTGIILALATTEAVAGS
jgi:hypothetical protein